MWRWAIISFHGLKVVLTILAVSIATESTDRACDTGLPSADTSPLNRGRGLPKPGMFSLHLSETNNKLLGAPGIATNGARTLRTGLLAVLLGAFLLLVEMSTAWHRSRSDSTWPVWHRSRSAGGDWLERLARPDQIDPSDQKNDRSGGFHGGMRL